MYFKKRRRHTRVTILQKTKKTHTIQCTSRDEEDTHHSLYFKKRGRHTPSTVLHETKKTHTIHCTSRDEEDTHRVHCTSKRRRRHTPFTVLHETRKTHTIHRTSRDEEDTHPPYFTRRGRHTPTVLQETRKTLWKDSSREIGRTLLGSSFFFLVGYEFPLGVLYRSAGKDATDGKIHSTDIPFWKDLNFF